MLRITLAARNRDELIQDACLGRQENETYGAPYYVPATVLDSATQMLAYLSGELPGKREAA